ncbi:MAG: AAA family ATPase [Candidatus Nealsonbacteria bacterium]|nr:AAA family ATPase [Candidatus Nealsonbacteria bacterium]
MKDYLIVFEEKGVFIFERDTKKSPIAKVVFPDIAQNEVFLPVVYPVLSASEEKIGEIQTWLPEECLFRSRINSKMSETIKDQKVIKIKVKNLIDGTEKTFEIYGRNRQNLSKEEADKLKEYGFTRGLDIIRNEKVGAIDFYEKKEGQRALLKLADNLSWEEFAILAVLDKINNQLKGKKIAEELIKVTAPTRAKTKIVYKTPEKEDEERKEVEKHAEAADSYREFVASLPATRQERATEYIDQNGEWDIFNEFMDRQKPVLINGPTGNGKSTMIKWYAKTRGQSYFKYTGHRDTALKDLVGLWVPTSGKPIKAPGPLTLAMVHGGIFHFEEIGPVSQEVLEGIHTVLDDKEIILDSQFGFEVIKAHPEFKMVSSGNLNRGYTVNEFNAASMERWIQIRLGYPNKENTTEIIASVTGIDRQIAGKLTEITFEMRNFLFQNYQMDFGLRGPVAVAEAFMNNSNQPLMRLIEVCMINPKATYDESDLRKRLREIVEKHFNLADSERTPGNSKKFVPHNKALDS